MLYVFNKSYTNFLGENCDCSLTVGHNYNSRCNGGILHDNEGNFHILMTYSMGNSNDLCYILLFYLFVI